MRPVVVALSYAAYETAKWNSLWHRWDMSLPDEIDLIARTSVQVFIEMSKEATSMVLETRKNEEDKQLFRLLS